MARIRRHQGLQLPHDLNYSAIPSLSNEEVEKLSRARPRTLQEASEISGVTPHAIGCLLVALRDHDARARQARRREAQASARDAAAGAGGDGAPGARGAGEVQAAVADYAAASGYVRQWDKGAEKAAEKQRRKLLASKEHEVRRATRLLSTRAARDGEGEDPQ